jgi:probable HAF family extracellular repeat protein
MKSPSWHGRGAAACISLAGVTGGAAGQQASLYTIGQGIEPFGISADGTVVVGRSGSAAFRWTLATGVTPIGEGIATGVSADGAVLAGFMDVVPQHLLAFRWTQEEGVVPLGTLPGDVDSDSSGISADGTVIVGTSGTFSPNVLISHAYVWTAASGMRPLGSLAGYSDATAIGVSGDGRMVVGRTQSGFNFNGPAFRWTAEAGMVSLGFLAGYSSFSEATAASYDGSVIIGRGNRPTAQNQAFRWTTSAGMIGLGFLPGHPMDTSADDISADGNIVVGGPTAFGTGGFIWTPDLGMVDLQSYLVAQGAANAADWIDLEPFRISADGTTIVGEGVICGVHAAWIARLSGAPLPPDSRLCYANCDCSTEFPILNAADFLCFVNRFSAGDSRANCDQSTTPPVLSVSDFVCFTQAFAAGCGG